MIKSLLISTLFIISFESFGEKKTEDNPQKTTAFEEIISINNKETGFEIFEALKEVDPFNFKKNIH